MRIDTTALVSSDPHDGVIVHGAIPKKPDQFCGNCKKKDDCMILNYSISRIDAIGMPIALQGMFLSNAELNLPMPCRGEAWEANISSNIQSDPLVNRLGLSMVSEPKMSDK